MSQQTNRTRQQGLVFNAEAGYMPKINRCHSLTEGVLTKRKVGGTPIQAIPTSNLAKIAGYFMLIYISDFKKKQVKIKRKRCELQKYVVAAKIVAKYALPEKENFRAQTLT